MLGTTRNIRRNSQSLKTLSSLLIPDSNPKSKPNPSPSNYNLYPLRKPAFHRPNWGIQPKASIFDGYSPSSYSRDSGLSDYGGRRWMSSSKRPSMRSKVERRMQRESGKTLKEIRRAQKLKKKIMTEEERLIYSLRRVF
uniref:Uncharacterized protein n=1 Tax=Opuntia streptacantha TaxID=393608 RepID=A0A7C9D842_OPUST